MKALTLRLDDETYERLRQEAFDGRTSITALVRDALAARGAAAPTVTAEAAAAHHPAKTGWSSRVGEFVICACQADRFGQGPQIAAADYPAHLLATLGIEVTP